MREVVGARRLGAIGRAIQEEANNLGLGNPHRAARDQHTWSFVERYDANVSNGALREATRALFVNGHYAQAVGEGFKCLNNLVKAKSGLQSADGDSLMRTVFSPVKPILRLNSLESSSERDEQKGYMDIYAGVMTGVRNPRAHQHELGDDPETAIELLTVANHLARKLNSARKRRKAKP